MSRQFVCSTCTPFYIEPEKKVVDTIFQQYERVLVESIITSFGLDLVLFPHLRVCTMCEDACLPFCRKSVGTCRTMRATYLVPHLLPLCTFLGVR